MSISATDLSAMRQDYRDPGLNEHELPPTWPELFASWLARAAAEEVPEPNAMVLATADAAGRPSARTVLLKEYDAAGLVFFTNYRSRKGTELAANPHASAVFSWLPLHRQVIFCGPVARVPAQQSAAYFASRPRGAQLGAWASAQSEVIADRQRLDLAYAEAARRFPDEVPAPEHWGGLRLAPVTVEFWQGRGDRLHDRLRYRRLEPGPGWALERLSP